MHAYELIQHFWTFPPSSCAPVLRLCILMALMMPHAAPGPLKVNSLTSAVSWIRFLWQIRPLTKDVCGSEQKECTTLQTSHCFAFKSAGRSIFGFYFAQSVKQQIGGMNINPVCKLFQPCVCRDNDGDWQNCFMLSGVQTNTVKVPRLLFITDDGCTTLVKLLL